MKSIAPSHNIIQNIRRSTSIEELLDNKLITQRTYNGCKYNGYTTVGSLLTLKDIDILRWHNCGRKVLAELRTLIDAINESYIKTEAEDGNNLNSEDGTNRFIQLQKNIFCYSVLLEVLGELKNSFNYKSSISIKKIQALETLVSGFDEAKDSTTHANVVNDIMDMVNNPSYKPIMERHSTQLNVLSESIEQTIGRVDDLIQNSGIQYQIKTICSNIIDTISLKDRFQFLSEDEIEFCKDYQRNHSKLPKLFILYKNLIRSEERQARMLCLRYGLYADRETKTLDEIGDIFHVHRERVRQLTDADGTAIKNISPKELLDDDFSEIEFVSEQEPAIIDLISEQNLTLTPKQMVVLIDILSRPLGSTSFAKNTPTYLFSWKMWKDIDFSRLEDYLKSIITQKRVKDIRLAIKDIIVNSNAFKNWHIYKYKTLKKVITCYLKDVRGIEPIDDEVFLWEQTHVSDEEILEIVSEKDSIVTKDDILKECENRFPELKVSCVENIAQNPLLSTVGLKGYVPKSERGRYFSSIGDCAEAILNEYGCPLSTEFLLTEIGERGYKTNENSLRSLLLRKDDDRFTRFVGDLWGLRTKEYNDNDAKTYVTLKKKSFTERLEELKEFISTNLRFPTCSSNETEASMVRWIRNTYKGLIDATDEQIEMLRNLIDSNSHLPQTQFEVRFINNCLEYRRVVEFLGKRPSVTSRPQLCMWFNSNLRKENLSLNNKKAFDNLLEWLEEKGVFYGI